MSETFEKEVTTQLREIREELKEHGEALARIDQKELNGEKQEEKDNVIKAHRLILYRSLQNIVVLG